MDAAPLLPHAAPTVATGRRCPNRGCNPLLSSAKAGIAEHHLWGSWDRCWRASLLPGSSESVQRGENTDVFTEGLVWEGIGVFPSCFC